jgi:hypothetical protein
MLECGSELGAVQGQVRMGNVGEAGADYAVEGGRIEQRCSRSEHGEFVAVSASDSLD